MAVITDDQKKVADQIYNKAMVDEAYRKKLLANPATELKKAGITDVPDDLKVEVTSDGQLNFSTSDQLLLEDLETRMTKSTTKF